MPGRTATEGTPAKEDFTGHERDRATQLHYAGARYYLSAYGRWNAVDPLADDFPAWSPYNYSYNDPLAFADPTGKAACDIVLCGQNGSSVTIETDLVDVEVDVSALPGTDFGGNHTIGGEDVVLAGLDLAGIVDPTGAADALAASMYAKRGEIGNTLISGAGLVPYVGDLGKAARVGKHIDAIEGAVKSSTSIVETATGILKPGGELIGEQIGRNSAIRTVSQKEAQSVVSRLITSGAELSHKSGYPGTWYKLPNGGGFGVRSVVSQKSKRLGSFNAIDLNVPGIPLKNLKY